MGSTYTTIVVRTADIDAVTASLVAARRSAYAAAAEGMVVVYDEQCDDQVPDDLAELAGELSRRHGCATLGVLLHDSDILWYTLHARGEQVDTYDSWPGYFEGADSAPQGGDAAALCEAFGRPDAVDEVEAVLHGERADCRDADERHQRLIAALGLPAASTSHGFRHIAAGEVPDGLGVADLRAAGEAPAPGTATVPAFPVLPLPMVRALPPLSNLVGDGPQPLTNVFQTIVQRVHAHRGFASDGNTFECDDALRSIFGAAQFRMSDVYPRLMALVEPADMSIN